MISFSCDKCRKKFRVSNDKGGKTSRCPGCGQVLHIPPAEGAPPQPFVRPGAGSPQGAPRAPQPPQRPHERYYPHRRHATAQHSSQAGRQRANLILLGVLLIIGFIMPVIQVHPFTGERRGDFINITILSIDQAPAQLKVLFLTPGLAGIGLLVLQAYTRHPARGIIILFFAAMPTLVALVNPESVEAVGALQKFMPSEAVFLMLVVFLGFFVAPVAMLVGIRSRGYRPNSITAYWFGVAGAGAWFAFLIMPALPAEAGHIFLMVPFKMMGQTGAGGVAMGLLILIVCTVISAILCINNKPIPEVRLVRTRAGRAFWIMVTGFIVFMLCISGEFLTSFPGFISSIKFLCWFLGMFLLFPAGITDLVVGRHTHPRQQTPEAEHPHTAPPDIPRRVV